MSWIGCSCPNHWKSDTESARVLPLPLSDSRVLVAGAEECRKGTTMVSIASREDSLEMT
jgi:hypothetical protein